jgi:hypothetical protein
VSTADRIRGALTLVSIALLCALGVVLLAGRTAPGSQVGCVVFHDAGGADEATFQSPSDIPVRLCGEDAEGSCDNARDMLIPYYTFDINGRQYRKYPTDAAYEEQLSDCVAVGYSP